MYQRPQVSEHIYHPLLLVVVVSSSGDIFIQAQS